jgi:hypothetical protein
MKATTTRRRFLTTSGWTGIGFLLFSYPMIGVAGTRTVHSSIKSNDASPVMRQGWLLNQDDL